MTLKSSSDKPHSFLERNSRCHIKTFKRRCEKAGIKTDLRLDLHGLRKSWAMNLANSGRVPPKTLLELGGWSSIRTCEEFYLKNTDANRQRACDVLNELAGG